MHTDWLVGSVLIAVGGLLAGGAAASPTWVFQMPKARALEAAVGRSLARVAYFVVGAVMVLVGLATIAGWMPKAGRRLSKTISSRSLEPSVATSPA